MKLKMTATHRRTMTAATLYPNGLLICHHEKKDKDAGTLSFFTAWDTETRTIGSSEGGKRTAPTLCLHHGLAKVFFDTKVEAVSVYYDNASERSRELNVSCDTVSFVYSDYALRFDLVSFLAHDITIQDASALPMPTYTDVMEKGYWNHREYKIANSPNV